MSLVKPYDQNGLVIVTFEAMFNGYADALSRFDAAAESDDPGKAFVPLFEALNWAVALDQRTAAHFVPDGKPAGYSWPTRIGYGALVMPGVRFVRNSVHHQWSDALELRGGAFPEWVWRTAEDLPALDIKLNAKNRRIYEENKQIYREHMEGRKARTALDALGGAFLFLKDLLEPFTIPRAAQGYVPVQDLNELDPYAIYPD
jgi:hypothetical protein